MKISMIGAGYVGLVSATCFAETGNTVSCVDIDERKVCKLSNSEITIYEPGLEILFKKNIRQKRLSFTTKIEESVKNSDIIFLALPTPPSEDGSADLKHVLSVAEKIGNLLEKFTLIVNKSTVPVGTAEKVSQKIAESAKVGFEVISNPEFLREGIAVDDFMKPDRVIVGATSGEAKSIMKRLYLPYVNDPNALIFMDVRSAELTKYASNSFLATKITFMNEMANLSERVGANIDQIRKGMGMDHRIGKMFLNAGIGYGGSCFPKDVQALVHSSNKVGYNFNILNAVMAINKKQKLKLIPKLESYFNGEIRGKVFSIWGLSFKPYTDDLREAPSLENIQYLLSKGAKIRVFDPEAMSNSKRILREKVYYALDEYDAIENTDALLIMTEWPVFCTPNFEILSLKMKKKAIFDGRNIYDPEQIKTYGFDYFSIGRSDK